MKQHSALYKLGLALSQGIHPKEITIAASAVDDELRELAGFAKHDLFPVGKVMGVNIRVVPDIVVIAQEHKQDDNVSE